MAGSWPPSPGRASQAFLQGTGDAGLGLGIRAVIWHVLGRQANGTDTGFTGFRFWTFQYRSAGFNGFIKDILHICGFCLREPRIRPVVLLCGLIMACHVTGLWAYFLLYQELRIGIAWFGVLFAVFQMAGALGGSRAHAFSERFGAGPVLLLGLLSPFFFVLLGLFPGVGLLPLIPANAFLWNLAYPVLLERLNLEVGSDVRATVLSLAGMAGSVIFIVVSPLFGRLVDAVSLSAAFTALGVFFLAAGAPLVAAILRRPQKRMP